MSMPQPAPPRFSPNHLSTDKNRSIAVASIRQAPAIMTARALAPHAPQEWLPGPGFQTDEALASKADDIATTIFHPVGTCRMGADATLVVDPHLCLRGIAGLRVLDG